MYYLKLFPAAIIVFTSLVCQGQKPDREKLGYYNYIQLPASNALEGSQFYHLSVELEDNDAYRRKLVEEKFDAAPYRQAGPGERIDFTVRIIEAPFNYGSYEKQSSRDKHGTNYYYKGQVRYHYTLKVFDSNDEEIFRDDVTGSTFMRGDHSRSLTEAHDNYIRKKMQIKEEVLMEKAPILIKIFMDQFLQVKKTIHLQAIRIKEKKFEYPEFNHAFEDLKTVYTTLQEHGEHTGESRKKLAGVMENYRQFLTDATPDRKKSKKDADVTAAAYYNLGLAHFFNGAYAEAAENFEQAERYDRKVVYGIDQLIETSADLARRATVMESLQGGNQ